MEENASLESAAVLGAAGKMGCGISWLLLERMAIGLTRQGLAGTQLILIDSNEEGFVHLRHYLEAQLKKYAEKNINFLRECYSDRKDLIENREMIEAFVKTAMDHVRFSTSLEDARQCRLIFEAIVEDVEIKSSVFQKLKGLMGPHAYYFTNTSSIPIEILQENSGLEGKLIGYHFYNPPAVQKLLEIVVPKKIDPHLKTQALELAKQLHKIVVFSNDVAGFIGNGHFIREVYFACQKVRTLSKDYSLDSAILLVDQVTQKQLLRPMGIFQLVDYVGIDIVSRIAGIMSRYLKEEKFLDVLIDQMLKAGITAGQIGNGRQKDGFFRYSEGAIAAVYDLKDEKYVPLSDLRYKSVMDQIARHQSEAD